MDGREPMDMPFFMEEEGKAIDSGKPLAVLEKEFEAQRGLDKDAKPDQHVRDYRDLMEARANGHAPELPAPENTDRTEWLEAMAKRAAETGK